MTKSSSLVFLALLFLRTLSVALPADSIRLASPNGQLVFAFSILKSGVPVYRIRYQNSEVIRCSRLGLRQPADTLNAPGATAGYQLMRVDTQTRNTTWKPVWGERDHITDHYNGLVLTLQKAQLLVQVEVRSYNEGVAFRYVVLRSAGSKTSTFAAEETEFNVPAETLAFWTPGAQATYDQRPVENWAEAAELPLTLRLSTGAWLSIAVADQTNAPRMRLKTAAKNQLVTEWAGETSGTLPLKTPWRVVLVGNRPGELVEHNDLIQNLNPPSQLKDASWIKPGKVMREVTLSTDGAKKVVDFAVRQNIDYIHFDAGWYGHEYDPLADATTVHVDPQRNPKGDLDLPEVIRYARSKGRKVMLYVNHLALERQLDTLFPLYQRWGVSGVKFGFVTVGSQYWTNWLHEAVKKAAQYQLVVDIHDDYRPSGFSRTYPNLLSQEGVLGNEGFPDATHNTILPFTRYVAGAGDYTFCFNTDLVRPGKGKTTQAHQLALPVIYFSPLQFLFWYGKPDQYANTAEFAFWKNLPTVWGDTRLVDGMPGEYVTTARRKGTDWYLGSITNVQARSILISLKFLPAGKRFMATLYEDDGRGGVNVCRKQVTASTILNANLRPSGGVAITLHAL